MAETLVKAKKTRTAARSCLTRAKNALATLVKEDAARRQPDLTTVDVDVTAFRDALAEFDEARGPRYCSRARESELHEGDLEADIVGATGIRDEARIVRVQAMKLLADAEAEPCHVQDADLSVTPSVASPMMNSPRFS